jgi:outer membrane protein assembly factor BamD
MAPIRAWFSRAGLRQVTVALLVCVLATSACARRKKYENPINKDTQQPDKVLFDKAINDIEKGRFEVARITLNTLINTYDTSEYLAKAKLAIADSWYREGGSHGLAQAEAEYKDFILFYPTMEEAAESQNRICDIHYKQMEKPDRDAAQAIRAEAECRQLLTQFPNSKFAPIAEQKLRNIQEAIGEGEYRVGAFYHKKGSHPAAANRLNGLVDQYPLYSKADEALWFQGDSYTRMGPRFRQKAGESYARIVREYPLSSYVPDAKKKLEEMEMPVPEADPVALNRMKFEEENRTKAGIVGTSLGILKRGPDVRSAAKSGTPAMTSLRPPVPASVPAPTAGAGFSGDVTAGTVSDSSTLDQGKEARQAVPANSTGATTEPAANPQQTQPLPTNQQQLKQQPKKQQKKQKETKKQTNAPAKTGSPAAEKGNAGGGQSGDAGRD